MNVETPASAPAFDEHAHLAPAASELRMAVFRFARRLRAERAIDGMSDGQFAVLAALKLHGPHTLGELAERERVTAPSMNRTVNCLEESGYLSRTPDESDRRKVVIQIAPAGLDVVEETVRRRDAWVEGFLASLDDGERATLASAAEILQRAVTR
ncbi:MarR family transcriptional regulator [Microbacterium sp. ARD31]|jgi:DNA-binding MarR family transcriptional regulator|uniref:MarR family winged helix-turn-helix transcriptional regulator n=1 Tax=Microbacterium sp. ARD31 TaxID=2962576 RepID=UPI002881D880|nr:MarR family transcriptional regulator [Microbacterium sp. ARD31]MDT0181762.1 MarR family transcriptional regulator [Microbacterium sp. ARD31]